MSGTNLREVAIARGLAAAGLEARHSGESPGHHGWMNWTR